jgi:arginine deiminase
MNLKITSEFTQLHKVMIHIPGAEYERCLPWEGEHPFLDGNVLSLDELLQEHNQLKAFLVAEIGAENVLTVSNLLAETFAGANGSQRQKILQDLVGPKDKARVDAYTSYLHNHGTSLENYPATELAADLIEGCPRTWDTINGNIPPSIFHPQRGFIFTRDSAAVTPVGVVIAAMGNQLRKDEPAIMRTIFKYHPLFGEESIAVDLSRIQRDLARNDSIALPWDYIFEGGNLLVLSAEALAIGVGRRTSLFSKRTNRAAFELMVKEIFKRDSEKKIQRVYLVNLPDLRGFIHLDTAFNMFGPKSALVMPFIFGHPDPGIEVFLPLVERIRADMASRKLDLRTLPTIEDFEGVGKTEVYAREVFERSGEAARLPVGTKYFLDQLVEDGIVDMNNVVWIGGNPEDHPNPIEHARVALREQIGQGGNIFTVKPFRLVAYHRNRTTLLAMEKKLSKMSADAHIERISSNELRTRHGGPHCLTMPLQRL